MVLSSAFGLQKSDAADGAFRLADHGVSAAAIFAGSYDHVLGDLAGQCGSVGRGGGRAAELGESVDESVVRG